MIGFLVGVIVGAVLSFVALVALFLWARQRKTRAANSIVHHEESAVAVVQSTKGGKKRVIHSH